ncbi:oxidized purine nucleoside triphosphate hydrolase-like [Bacillus rossius redtenbacheri]|uniref:oxidized purine nucleoside triphosphate hydrolase-like n=1 Tax=Bacillus rossius redtenbacheri TaxID=93214 RepID=UPI002FDEBA1E
MSGCRILTLVLVRKANKILLGLKKRGFGEGKWNGFGGKVEAGETILEAAKREVREECSLEVDSLEKVGVLQFEFLGQPPALEVHVFGTSSFTGEPVDTEEMSPKWFSIGEVPFDRMWPDDRIWFPMYLGEKKFQGHFLYEGLDHIRSHTLVAVDHLPS